MPTDFAFDATNPRATEWAAKHAAKLVKDISKTTRENIRAIIVDAFESQVDVTDTARAIYEELDNKARALMIARTEIMRASNKGQIEAWAQAVEEGYLTGDEQKEWLVADPCDLCKPMEGRTAFIWDDFVGPDGETMDDPPLHPNCECSVGLGAKRGAKSKAAEFNPAQPRDDHGRWSPTGFVSRSDRAERAQNPFTLEKDQWAAKSEKRIAHLLKGTVTPPDSPVDVVVSAGGKMLGIEVKTLLDNTNDKITVRGDALDRKLAWARSNHASLHTIVVDERKAFGQLQLYSGNRLYYRHGVGSFRLGALTPVENAPHLLHLMQLDRLRAAGGAGSGNFGHEGRPGEVGGSASNEWRRGSSLDFIKPSLASDASFHQYSRRTTDGREVNLKIFNAKINDALAIQKTLDKLPPNFLAEIHLPGGIRVSSSSTLGDWRGASVLGVYHGAPSNNARVEVLRGRFDDTLVHEFGHAFYRDTLVKKHEFGQADYGWDPWQKDLNGLTPERIKQARVGYYASNHEEAIVQSMAHTLLNTTDSSFARAFPNTMAWTQEKFKSMGVLR